jgi:hypothetical protein
MDNIYLLLTFTIRKRSGGRERSYKRMFPYIPDIAQALSP